MPETSLIQTARRTNQRIGTIQESLKQLAEDDYLVNMDDALMPSITRMIEESIRLANWAYIRLRHLERMAAADRAATAGGSA